MDQKTDLFRHLAIAMQTYVETDADAFPEIERLVEALRDYKRRAQVLRAWAHMNLYLITVGNNQNSQAMTQAFNSIGAKVHQEMGMHFVATNQTLDQNWVTSHLGSVVGGAAVGGNTAAIGGAQATGGNFLICPIDVEAIGSLISLYPSGFRTFLTQAYPDLKAQAA